VTDSKSETQTVAHILEHYQTVAVVGLSPKPHRDSYGVAAYLQARGWRIIPINPNASEILGEKAYASLTEASRHETIELVDVFRNSDDVPPVVDEAIAIGAKAVWLQLGIRNEQAAAKARQAGLYVVQNRCIKIDLREWTP
jgi:predicted CoA-binding protein